MSWRLWPTIFHHHNRKREVEEYTHASDNLAWARQLMKLRPVLWTNWKVYARWYLISECTLFSRVASALFVQRKRRLIIELRGEFWLQRKCGGIWNLYTAYTVSRLLPSSHLLFRDSPKSTCCGFASAYSRAWLCMWHPLLEANALSKPKHEVSLAWWRRIDIGKTHSLAYWFSQSKAYLLIHVQNIWHYWW